MAIKEIKAVEEKLKRETNATNLTITLMRLIGMWPVTSKRQKLLSKMLFGIIFISMIIASCVEAQEFYFSKNNLMLLIYSAPITVVVICEFAKLIVFTVNRPKVLALNNFISETYWKADYNNEEMRLFNECDKFCYKAIVLYTILLQSVGWHFVLAPAFESIGKNTSEREFPFPIYIDNRAYENPFYPILYSCQIFGTLAVSMCATIFASYLFAMNLFTAAQFKILSMHLRGLCDFEDDYQRPNKKLQMKAYEVLKNCVRNHRKLIGVTDELENLFCYAMLGQLFVSVLQICFTGFQILLAKYATYQRTILSVEYLIGSFLQLYFYCYSSHEIYTESENVAEAMYSTKWYRITDKNLHKDFKLLVQIVIHRARRPCLITAGKFAPLNLETFSSVLRSSISYFTVLRQTIE